ncbi:MAG TPA: GntR family transcriptional regulator [Woeseiaceae bacterium]|nr:GntR family transcriptional regulator [Woeseiaceae bacterium]
MYRDLKQAILGAQVKPGEILSIRVIAEDFNTSTMPVREAAARLISEGALEAIPNRGLRVPTLTKSRAKEIFDIRVILESYACEIAAAHVTKTELDVLKRLERQMEQAFAENNVKRGLRLNMEFHFHIYKAARCLTILPLIESLWLQYAPTLYNLMDAVGDTGTQAQFVHNHHSAIIEALEQRSPHLARNAMLDDLNSTANIPAFWDKLGADNS